MQFVFGVELGVMAFDIYKFLVLQEFTLKLMFLLFVIDKNL